MKGHFTVVLCLKTLNFLQDLHLKGKKKNTTEMPKQTDEKL